MWRRRQDASARTHRSRAEDDPVDHTKGQHDASLHLHGVGGEGIDGRDATLEIPAPAAAVDRDEELGNEASHCAQSAPAPADDDY